VYSKSLCRSPLDTHRHMHAHRHIIAVHRCNIIISCAFLSNLHAYTIIINNHIVLFADCKFITFLENIFCAQCNLNEQTNNGKMKFKKKQCSITYYLLKNVLLHTNCTTYIKLNCVLSLIAIIGIYIYICIASESVKCLHIISYDGIFNTKLYSYTQTSVFAF